MAKGYRVGIPRLDQEISASGTGFTKVWEIPYSVTSGPATGTEAYIRIPAAEYSPDIVGAAIEHAVAVHHEIMSLGDGPKVF